MAYSILHILREETSQFIEPYENEEFVEELVSKYIQSKTDVPLKIYVNVSKNSDIVLKIYPKITLDDFLTCKYKKWFLNPSHSDGVYGSQPFKDELVRLLNSKNIFKFNEIQNRYYGPFVFYEVVWPEEITEYILEKNKILRDLFYQSFDKTNQYDVNFNSIAIDYGPCEKDSHFLIGLQNKNKQQKINKFIQTYYPNTSKANIGYHNPFGVSKLYDYDDKKYWGKRKMFDWFTQESKRKFGDIYSYDIDKFDGMDKLSQVFCKQHQRWFELIPNEHLGGKRCPLDNESKGETMVRVYLEKNNIPFKQYHKLKGCFSEINGKCILLTFDFYLPENNTVIEYDGEQHYKPVERFGGEDTFKRQVILDGIKNTFCEKSGIKIIRIPYTVKTPKDIQSVLESELS